ncbi:MAG: segregation/condensation protein A [Tissierellia bacterium]|nr:segregation/condensation protein A [Tissierellia bacterium]
MTYTIQLPTFNGPMDLLLDLIKKHKMSIYDIEIHLLCDAFLEEIQKMEELNMDLTSDFIEMASLLLRIKSDSLLPREEDLEEGEEEEEDPRQGLIEKLIEYEKLKTLTEALNARGEYEKKAFYKQQEDFSYFNSQDLLAQCDLEALSKAFYQIMERTRRLEKAQADLEEIPQREFSYQRAHGNISKALLAKPKLMFSDLLKIEGGVEACIAYFLVLLELIKNQEVYARQVDFYEDIEIGIRRT